MDKAARKQLTKLLMKKGAMGQKTLGGLINEALTGEAGPVAQRALAFLTGVGGASAIGGSLAGAGLGAGLAKLTSPAEVSPDTLQSTELNQAYQRGIQDVKDRIERRLAIS